MNNTTNNHNKNSYQFQPINQHISSTTEFSQINIQRPIPVPYSNSKKSSEKKRNSTMNLDTTIRSYGLPRSMTTDQLSKNTSTNRLYYYPSVQDVLDALNRCSFDKESIV